MTAPSHPPAPTRGRPKKKLGPRGVEYRRVFVVGNSLAVSLSPSCAGLLRATRGTTVQVVPEASGKVIITRVGFRPGTVHELANAAREVVSLRRELLKAKKRLLSLPVRQVNRGFNAGFLKAYRAELQDVRAGLDQVAAGFAELCAILRPSSAEGSKD